MNRFTFPSLVLFCLAAGCSSQGVGAAQQSGSLTGEQQARQRFQYPAAEAVMASAQYAAPASALVFDLPVASDIPPLNLDRDSRQPGAFVGFEGPSIEYHTVLINNTQSVGGIYGSGCGLNGDCNLGDSYQRQDLIERTSVRYR